MVGKFLADRYPSTHCIWSGILPVIICLYDNGIEQSLKNLSPLISSSFKWQSYGKAHCII
jgi:hypothetical protein